MHNKGRFPNVMFGASLRPESAALAVMVLLLFLIFVFLFLMLTAQPAQAQTFKVIHNFTGGGDGFDPVTGLTMDRAGNLYGTTGGWGVGGNDCTRGTVCGTVFKVSPSGVLNTLHKFAGGGDGGEPYARVTLGPDGSLY